MYAHLFDHDNVFINQTEALVAHFVELCGVTDKTKAEYARERLVAMCCLDLILSLLNGLPEDKKKEYATSIKDSPTQEAINKFKAEFEEKKILEEYYKSVKKILTEKIDLIKSNVPNDKLFEMEELVKRVGKT